MLSKNCIALILCVAVICESSFIDTLVKCGKDDGECQGNQMQNMLRSISHGVPELDIPPIDPAEIKNFKISVLNLIDMTLDGVAKGAKKCIVNRFTPNFDGGVAKLDITCNMTVKGKYKVFSDSSTVKSFFDGESIHGDGNGKVKIDGLNLKMEMPYDVEKRDGEIYLIGKKEKLKYSYDIGNVVFSADSLYIGKKESSATLVSLLNQNWKLLIGTFGKEIVKTALDLVYAFAEKFFAHVPAKAYIIEDLSSYVKN